MITITIAFFAVFFLIMLIMALGEYRRATAMEGRLVVVRAQRVPLQSEALMVQSPAAEAAEDDDGGGFRAVLALFVGWLQRSLVRRGRHRPVEARLKQAGLRLRAAEYFFLRVAGSVGGGFLAVLIIRIPLWFLPVAAGCFFLPELYVEKAIKKRRRAFIMQLPDVLTTVSNSLRTGFSFLQALEVAAEEMADPAAGELRQVVRETQVDIPLEDALANLYGRMPLPEVQLVITAVLIQRQVGGNLAALLDQVGQTVRMRLGLERELRALTSQGRLSGWIVGFLPVALGGMLFLINKDYVSLLFTNILGQFMLGTAVTLEAMGAFFIRRMVQMEV